MRGLIFCILFWARFEFPSSFSIWLRSALSPLHSGSAVLSGASEAPKRSTAHCRACLVGGGDICQLVLIWAQRPKIIASNGPKSPSCAKVQSHPKYMFIRVWFREHKACKMITKPDPEIPESRLLVLTSKRRFVPV